MIALRHVLLWSFLITEEFGLAEQTHGRRTRRTSHAYPYFSFDTLSINRKNVYSNPRRMCGL